MPAIVGWIIAAITTAWAALSGGAVAASVAAIAAAVSLMPTKVGEVATDWLSIANFYLPIVETFNLSLVYVSILASMKVARWASVLKK